MKRGLLPLAVAAAWCALILFVHRNSARTLVSAHGLLHAAIAEEFADPVTRPPLATPPENPLFAGTPLPYYYFFHAAAAQLASLLGTDVLHAFELMVLAAAFGTVLLGFRLAGRVLPHPVAVRAGGIAFALLFFAGAHPQGPLVLLARWIRDGSAPLEDRGQYLWGLVHPINGALRIGDYWGTLGPLATYFFNVTARPVALAALVLVIAMLAAAIGASQRRRPLALLRLALAAALCTLFSPLLGLASAAALAAALVYVAVRWRRLACEQRSRDPAADESGPDVARRLSAHFRAESRAQLLGAAALVAGAALAWPWYRHLLGGAAGRIELGFNPKRALGVVASCWLVALLAARQPRTILAESVAWTQALKLASLFLAIPTAFVSLPVGNEDNFLHAALVCWSVVAAGAAVPLPDRPGKPPEGGG
jgi:hypothetical protein